MWRRSRKQRSASPDPVFIHREASAVSSGQSFDAEREAAFHAVLGPWQRVHKDPGPDGVAIDAYEFAPSPGRDFGCLLTSGMSDARMPAAPERGLARAELVMYVDQPQPHHAALLRRLARMPHAFGSWFGVGHTVEFEDGSPLFPDSLLSAALFLQAPEPEASLREELVLDGEPVNPLWVFPLTPDESSFKVQHGLEPLLERLEASDLEVPLDEGRRSVLSS